MVTSPSESSHRVLVPTSISVLSGAAWGWPLPALAFAPLVFFAWWRAPTRLGAWWVVTTYHLVAARSLIVGGTRFFGVSHLEAFLLVLFGAALVSAPWALCWCSSRRSEGWLRATLRAVAALTLSSVPPIGAFCVSSPLVAAGVWWPGAGLTGLGGIAAAGVAMRINCGRVDAVPLARQFAFWLVCCAAVSWRASCYPPARIDPRTTPVNTRFAASPDDMHDLAHQWHVATHVMNISAEHSDQTLVLPEGVGGLWQPAMVRAWTPLANKLLREGRHALVGATIPLADGSFRAGAVLLGSEQGDGRTYLQRVPMPFAMWRPWSFVPAQFRANWFGPGTIRLAGRRTGVLICWEIGSPWAVVRSAMEGAEVLLGLANIAWLHDTGANAAQQQALESWGALFALPVVRATNS
jgi:apolipoprotein N-acyltransferase